MAKEITTRYTAGCCDSNCWARSCMWPGEDKGSYTVGRGYTSYYKNPIPECMTRMRNGCPDTLPASDPENARCCFRPNFKNIRKNRKTIPCETCGTGAPGKVAKILQGLPTLPGVSCKHENQHKTMLLAWRECPDCKGFWAGRNGVHPFEVPTHTLDDMLEELKIRLSKVDARIPKETS